MQQNGKLFEPKNETQNEAMREFAKEKINPEDHPSAIWLGISDHGVEGVHRYSSDFSKVTWSKFGESSAGENPNDNTKNCVDMYLENGKWFHKNCKEERAFVCEYLNDPDTTSGILPLRARSCIRQLWLKGQL